MKGLSTTSGPCIQKLQSSQWKLWLTCRSLAFLQGAAFASASNMSRSRSLAHSFPSADRPILQRTEAADSTSGSPLPQAQTLTLKVRVLDWHPYSSSSLT